MKTTLKRTPAQQAAFERLLKRRKKYWDDLRCGVVKPTAKQKKAWTERGKALVKYNKAHTWKNELKGHGELRRKSSAISIDNLLEISCKLCGAPIGITLRNGSVPSVICNVCNHKLILDTSALVLYKVLHRKKVGHAKATA